MKHSHSAHGSRWADGIYRWAALLCAAGVLVLAGALFVELVLNSMPSISKYGAGFLTSQSWDPVSEEFGAASSIFGTLVSTFIALVIAVPLSLVTALFLVELAPPRISSIAGGAIELLAAIPSIIYGMWGLFVFAPYMADHVQPFLQDTFPGVPLFAGAPMGIGMLTSGIILALMVLPFITSVTRDIFRLVPPVLKESAYGLGSTTWEVTHKVTVKYGMRGVVGAIFLGLGRAIGETMAVTFVIGNDHRISASLFDAGNSIASTLANEFSEASEPMYLSALVELGLVLLLITVVIQSLAQLWLWMMQRSSGVRS